MLSVRDDISKNNLYTWTSENPEIAEVNENGVVKGNISGYTKIKVESPSTFSEIINVRVYSLSNPSPNHDIAGLEYTDVKHNEIALQITTNLKLIYTAKNKSIYTYLNI